MNNSTDRDPSEPTASSVPPAPFRTSPWFDPALLAHSKLKPERKAERDVPRLLSWRVCLVVLGGVVLPIVSMVLNESLHVVRLGTPGIVLLSLTVLSNLLNLVLVPIRRDPRTKVSTPSWPQATWLRLTLFLLAFCSALLWGYLAVLFFPLIPLSILGLLYLGIGFCGLCPYAATAIAVIQLKRAGAALALRVGRTWVIASASSIAALVLGAAFITFVRSHQAQQQLTDVVTKIERSAPFSRERMELIQQLAGDEDRIVGRAARTSKPGERRLLAEAYQRLTDQPIGSAKTLANHRNERWMIHPWWFAEDGRFSTATLNRWLH
jgi:hypothetical protein